MKGFERYKHPGIQWIGEIPNYWTLKSLKYCAELVLGKMLTNDDKGNYINKPYLRAKNIEWIKPNIEDVKSMWFSEKELDQYRIKSGDLLVSEGGEVGRTCIWEDQLPECYIQNSVHKLTLLDGYNPRFFLYIFFLYGQRGHFDAIVNRISIAHLTKEKLGDIKVAVPSFEEQCFIADYLDRKTSQINTLISKKERLIELLQEERSAVIDAATNEQNSDWKSVPIRYLIMSGCLEQQDGNHGELHPVAAEFTEDGIPFIMANHLTDGEVDLTNCKYISEERAEKLRIGFAQPGDVLLTHKGTLGRVAIVQNNIKTKYIVLTPQVTYYRCIKNIHNEFLAIFFQSRKFQDQFALIGGEGTTRAYVGLLAQRVIKIDFPKRIEEQIRIVTSIQKKITSINFVIDKIQNEIRLLSEYRTALISEAVTGKIDVRQEALIES
jgi:type I restriction enzyme S subunit